METLRSSTVIDTVLLKVASRCNLDCSYCYVYHLGDDRWRNQPKQMSETVQSATARQLAELRARQKQPLSVVLHGGEPLLVGADRLRDMCGQLRSALPPPCGVHVQTNGVLLTDEIIDIFVRFGVGVSISIDGPVDLHDRFRVDHRGRGSYEHVRGAIRRLVARADARPLFAGVLAVNRSDFQPRCGLRNPQVHRRSMHRFPGSGWKPLATAVREGTTRLDRIWTLDGRCARHLSQRP